MVSFNAATSASEKGQQWIAATSLQAETWKWQRKCNTISYTSTIRECENDQHCCLVQGCNSGQGHRSSEGDGGSCVFDTGAFSPFYYWGAYYSMYNKESWVYQQLLAEGDMCSHCEAYRQAWTPGKYVRRPLGPPECKATHEIADGRHTEDSTKLVSLSPDEY